jgi:hypothetical protein
MLDNYGVPRRRESFLVSGGYLFKAKQKKKKKVGALVGGG